MTTQPHLRILLNASRIFAEDEQDLHALLEQVARFISEATGDTCVIRLLTEDGQHLEPVAAHHPDPQQLAELRAYVEGTLERADQGLWAGVLRDRRLVRYLVERGRVPPEASERQAAFLRQQGIRSVLCVPLAAGDRVLGGIALARSGDRQPLSEADEAMLSQVAEVAALSIENARLIQAERNAREQLEALNAELEARVERRTAELQETVRELQQVAEQRDGERALLEALLASMTDGVLLLDREDRIRFINATAERFLGLEAGSAVGRPVAEVWEDLGQVEGLEELRRDWREILSTAAGEMELEHRVRGAEKRTLVLSLFGVPGVGTGALLHDVTEERALQAKQLERERDETVAELARRVAHELLNPLGAATNAWFLLRSRLGEQAAPALERMQTEHRRIERLVRDLLAYAEGMTLSVEIVALGEPVRAALKEIQVPAAIEVEVDVPELQVRGDRRLLRQLVEHLVENAVESMGTQGRLEIRGSEETGEVMLEFRDSGPGIAEEHRERIFDALYTTKVGGGFGLGLAAALKIAEAHGGTITLHTPEGEGSTFRVALPKSG